MKRFLLIVLIIIISITIIGTFSDMLDRIPGVKIPGIIVYAGMMLPLPLLILAFVWAVWTKIKEKRNKNSMPTNQR